MADFAVRARGLGKRYRLGTTGFRYGLLRESVAATLAHPLRSAVSLFRSRDVGEGDCRHIWALRDVDLDVGHGDAVGIVGRNGSGKSTLLKVLSRVTRPTRGWAEVRGRVGALLEVGTGFHLELTGRENVFLAGAVLGMRKAEITRKFDEIVAFAEIERFLDTPVKRYSSGMYVRLAFAVAAHLDPDVLVVDEVLAVGDLAFQKRCLGKMGDAAQEGRTVLFVSHNLGTVRRLCRRVGLLEAGRLVAWGEPDDVLEEYLRRSENANGGRLELPRPEADSGAAATRLVVRSVAGEERQAFRLGEPFDVGIDLELGRQLEHVVAGLGIAALDGTPIITYWSLPADLGPGCYCVDFEVRLPLAAGAVQLQVGLFSNDRSLHSVDNAGRVTISDIAVGAQPYRASGAGLLFSTSESRIRQADGGE